MVGPQPLNQPGTKGNVESPIGSTRYATPRRGHWLGWLVRVEARRVSPKCIPPNGLVKGNGSKNAYTGGRHVCAGDEGQGAVCRG